MTYANTVQLTSTDFICNFLYAYLNAVIFGMLRKYIFLLHGHSHRLYGSWNLNLELDNIRNNKKVQNVYYLFEKFFLTYSIKGKFY